jgi:hypothetical protein
MIGLISSMAEETQALRLQFGNAPGLVGGGGGGNKNIFQEANVQHEKSKLISVSDDEDDTSSEEEYSSDEEDNQSEDMDEDNDSDDEIETHVIKINSENLKISNDEITIFENIVSQPQEEEEEEEDSLSDDEVDEILEINLDDHTIDENEIDEPLPVIKEYNHEDDHEILEPLDSLNVANVENNIKTIHIDLEQMSSSTDEIKDISIFKTMNEIDVDGQPNQSQKVIDTADFKKLSITKLREIISKQGATDASKLKKNEILKLLGVEQ